MFFHDHPAPDDATQAAADLAFYAEEWRRDPSVQNAEHFRDAAVTYAGHMADSVGPVAGPEVEATADRLLAAAGGTAMTFDPYELVERTREALDLVQQLVEDRSADLFAAAAQG